jgi:hypothetical protein
MPAMSDKTSSLIPEKGRIILVEGKDDALLIGAICELEGFGDAIQLVPYRQRGKLVGVLDLLVRRPEFEQVARIGLTRDSDDGAASATQSMSDAWRRTQGTLRQIGTPAPECHFFAIPDNMSSGRLENLCLLSATFPEILVCAERMHECAREASDHDIDREKGIVAAYLSMMDRPGLELGTAAKAGCWNLRSEAFAPLRDFVRLIAK